MIKRNNKLLLIGWDAADWKIIGPLLAKGEMPALKHIIDNGVYGNMSTMNPPYSPMLWTSVATGKTPEKHGILGFVEILDDKTGVRPVTTNSRKVRAIWNILTHHGLSTNLIGWWPSYPAEPIKGVVISDKYQKVDFKNPKKNKIFDGVVHPKSVIKDFEHLRMFPQEITGEHVLPFIPDAHKIDQEKSSGLVPFSKIMAHNVSVHNAVTKLLRTSDWDFTAVYYDLIDHFCHAYMKFHPPKLEAINQIQYDLYKDAVVGAYKFQDMMLERKLDLIDDNTTVIVMSDHGYESGDKRLVKLPKVQAAAAMDHRQFGMFAAMGPNIKKNEKVFGLGLTDITPTILHHFGLPIGEDMDGQVAIDIFKASEKPQYIESWENIEGDFGELKSKKVEESFSDKETIDQLIELGYIDKPSEKIETAVLKTNLDLKHNLARVLLAQKQYEKAERILLKLIKTDGEVDLSAYYYDLVNVNIEKKNYDKALNYLNVLKEIKSEVKYALFFPEADILMGKGKAVKALNVLESARDNNRQNNSELYYRIGYINHSLGHFEKANNSFERAIEIEPDRAKFHASIAENFIELGNFEEAVDSALTSIELVKYYSKAHYVLGRALEKLGDLKNSKIAFETASKLTPKSKERINRAIENLNYQSEKRQGFLNKQTKKYYDNQIVVVSGLPRSGTSLMMQMLTAGGIEPLVDGVRKPDLSNPKGYLEYKPVMGIKGDNSWLGLAQDKCLKVVCPLLKFLSSKYRYKVIFMSRNLIEIIKSQQKMIGRDEDAMPFALIESYEEQLKKVELWKNKEPGVELLYVQYKDLFSKPNYLISEIESFIGIELDKSKMAQCVDPELYRTRT